MNIYDYKIHDYAFEDILGMDVESSDQNRICYDQCYYCRYFLCMDFDN